MSGSWISLCIHRAAKRDSTVLAWWDWCLLWSIQVERGSGGEPSVPMLRHCVLLGCLLRAPPAGSQHQASSWWRCRCQGKEQHGLWVVFWGIGIWWGKWHQHDAGPKLEPWDPQGGAVQITAQKEDAVSLKNGSTSIFLSNLSSPKVPCWSNATFCLVLVFAFSFEQNVLPSFVSKNLEMKTHSFHFGESRKRSFITSEFFTHLSFWTNPFDEYSSGWQIFSLYY